jgi:uncharacterized protein (TIGR02145 family)
VKNLLILLGVFCALKANAQDYYISFTGSGSSSSVSTVKVENQTSGTSLVMNGGYILHLTSITTGVNSTKNEPFSQIKIYPNPATDYTTVQIYPPVAGEAVFTVFEITGKPTASVQYNLDNSRQDFRLSGMKAGLYLISVTGTNYRFSEKLICGGEANGPITIERINSIGSVSEKKDDQKVSKGLQTIVDMSYSDGDRLKFTGTSGNYRTIWTDIPTSDKTVNFDFIPCTDGDNNNYPVVIIGTQVWMAENLKTIRYNNGDLIQTTTPATKSVLNEMEPIYQWSQGGNENNAKTFGRLYTWYSIEGNTVCPAGWHIPTDSEWAALTDYLGGLDLAGIKLKEMGLMHWTNPNSGAIDEIGFAALPGGYRYSTGGFGGLGSDGIWWSLTEGNNNDAWTQGMSNNSGSVYGCYNGKRSAYSVRCVQGEVKVLPVIISNTVTNITISTATAGGNIRSDGCAPITARGVCWGTSPNPTIADNKTTDGTGAGVFTSSITGLTPNTSYHLRAYATNSVGTSYGNDLIFKSYTGTLTDIDGNVYYTVTIGTQVWTAENLKTSHCNDGTLITKLSVIPDWEEFSTPGYWIDAKIYGYFYNWWAVNPGKLCPTGWHVPSDPEWKALEMYLGMTQLQADSLGSRGTNQGIQLKSTSGWLSGVKGTNASGFSALAGGMYFPWGFVEPEGDGKYGVWWTSTENDTYRAYTRSLWYNSNKVRRDYSDKQSGYNVRCLKDN